MIKRLLLSLVLFGSSCGVILAREMHDAAPETYLSGVDKNIYNVVGRTKRSKLSNLIEQLTLAFIKGGKDTPDGKFDTLKGATTARDGFYKAAAEVMVTGAVAETLKAQNVLVDGVEKQWRYGNYVDVAYSADDKFSRYGKIWTKLGLDFFLRGVKYANGTEKNKSFASYLKNEYLPSCAKKLTVYWTAFGLEMGAANLLGRSAIGTDIMKVWAASKVIPFVGVVIEDALEDTIEAVYDKSLPKAKALAATLKHTLLKQQPVAACAA